MIGLDVPGPIGTCWPNRRRRAPGACGFRAFSCLSVSRSFGMSGHAGVSQVTKKICAHPGCPCLIEASDRFCVQHKAKARQSADRARDRARSGPVRRWYSSAAWRGRRERQLAKEPMCRRCAEMKIARLATVADHIEPHRGDAEKFWRGALMSLCQSCHSGWKQRLEARAARPAGGGGWFIPWGPRHGDPTQQPNLGEF